MTTMRPPAFRHPILIVAAAIAVVAGSYAWTALRGTAVSQSTTAVDPATVEGVANGAYDPAALPAANGRMSIDDQIAFWSARVKRTPGDFPSLVELALAEAAKARLTADLDLYVRARSQLQQALVIDPRYGTALRAMALIQFTLHDFAGATVSAEAALDRKPNDDGARAILGDAQLELGRIADATATYAGISPDAAGPALDARHARLDLLTGRGTDAVGLAQRAYDAALADQDEYLAFYAYQLGETARQAGDAELARRGFGAALALQPNELGSLVGLARVDAAAGQIDSALAGLRHAAAIAPQPDTLALLGDLLALRGDPGGAKTQYDTVRAIASLSSIAGSVYDRQLVLFELDHGGATATLLAHARAALAARPDATGHDVVAWGLYRLGQFDGALAESRLALASGTRDARILAHAGAIELANGDAADGRRDIQTALDLRPALDPLTTTEVTRLLAST